MNALKLNQLLELIQKKVLDFQRTLDKLKALRLKANSLSSSSSKSCFSQLNNQQENGDYDDFEGDEDARACFPCPFCYVEIEIHALCNHLQEEHCFDLKNAVCPLCAANLGKDVIGHFIVQHASSLKRRRKSQKSGIWPGSPATLGRELCSFIGSSTGVRGNAHESGPDLFPSPFLCNAPVSDPRDVLQYKCFDDEATFASNLKRIEPPLLDKDHEQNTEERRRRAAFVQRLVMSTIF
ncbi:hypothetical protein REPUB_Repub07fG0002800 [Reevesia pubescens]